MGICSSSSISTDKAFMEHIETGHVYISTCSRQGKRQNMEDQHTCKGNFRNSEMTFLGLYDGHRGPLTSTFLRNNAYKLCEELKEINEESLDSLLESLDKSYGKFASEHDDPEYANCNGSTSLIAIIDHKDAKFPIVTLANSGDSRAIRGGFDVAKNLMWYKQITTDHSPNLESERKRIEEAGGIVSKGSTSYRINGEIAVARAIGDFQYKTNPNLPLNQQLLIPNPQVYTEILSNNEWLLLACDGIFESLSTEKVASFVSIYLRNNRPFEELAQALCDEAYHYRSNDNMSCIVVRFKDIPEENFETKVEEQLWYPFVVSSCNSMKTLNSLTTFCDLFNVQTDGIQDDIIDRLEVLSQKTCSDTLYE